MEKSKKLKNLGFLLLQLGGKETRTKVEKFLIFATGSPIFKNFPIFPNKELPAEEVKSLDVLFGLVFILLNIYISSPEQNSVY